MARSSGQQDRCSPRVRATLELFGIGLSIRTRWTLLNWRPTFRGIWALARGIAPERNW